MAKQTIDVPDTETEGKAVASIVKVFASLENQEAINRVAQSVAMLCSFSVETF